MPFSAGSKKDPILGVLREAGLGLLRDYAMPVNNRTLVWRKRGPA